MKTLSFFLFSFFILFIGCSNDNTSSSIPAKEVTTVICLGDVDTPVSGEKEVTKVSFTLDASQLGGKYWLINSPSASYYVWYDINDSSSKPTISGTAVAVEVDLAGTENNITVASYTSNAINFSFSADYSVSWSSDNNFIDVTNVNMGVVDDALPGNAASNVSVTTQGVTQVDLNSLSGEYFIINSSETNYYVWFDVGNNPTDPNVAEKTGVEIDIAAGESATSVAAKVQTAVDGLTGLSATVSGDIVTITADAEGDLEDANAGNSGFTVNITTQGN